LSLCINRTPRKLEELLIFYPHTSTYSQNILKICKKSKSPCIKKNPKNVKDLKGCYPLASTKPHQKQRP
jgi:hypothetical protein